MSWLDDALTRVALCWRIERRDGVTIGLTAHDRDLTIDGLPYRAAPGMTPSAIQRAGALDEQGMEARGPLSHAAISEADLIVGRWDGAAVGVFAVDWRNPARRVPLGEGRIGDVSVQDGAFTAELSGGGGALDAPVSERTSPDCRAELGDARCQVPMAGRRCHARIVAQDGETLTLDRAEPVANGYAHGRLRWIGGALSGIDAEIAGSAEAAIMLRAAPARDVVGALVEIAQGCDGRFATCRDRFGNAANFRGEPHLPGIDLLTRYPGG